jgi:hypothetical protein
MKFIVMIPVLVLMVGCSTSSKLESSYVDSEGRAKLSLVPQKNKSEITQYSSRGITRIYKGETLERKTKEDVDFEVEQKVISVDPVKKHILYEIKTIGKKGEGDLHEFAVPELNEVIQMTLDSQANVISAGKYEPTSVFYVPPVSLPKEAVAVDESWVMKKQWITMTNQLPLEIEIVSILKDIFSCQSGKCAKIEISGEVTILGADPKVVKLESLVRGYMIFSLDLGTIIWSHVLNDQNLITKEFRAKSQSCLVSYVSQPEWTKLKGQVNPYCKAEGNVAEIKVPTNI